MPTSRENYEAGDPAVAGGAFFVASYRILHRLGTVALWIAATGLAFMTAFTAWQVFSRYVLNQSPSWTEPVALLLMGWFIFLGAAVGVREDTHLGFDVIVVLSGRRMRKVLLTIRDLATLGFGGAMAWYGLLLAIGTWSATMPALGIPASAGYASVVIGGVLIVLFSLERLARRFAGLEIA
ncbi:TRAP transporter small permease [Methylobrevis albus]|uniref:TRAP transporter small permease protein n=1 Tax=Methylobrevis albus TaxID=2793297 RepID=A0A931I1T3_9HYPH|nr:TRAP transporter small permease [Methylobrevis albus]MBH0237691.1 TRAP transporter small permease [Methylobrevis albus]